MTPTVLALERRGEQFEVAAGVGQRDDGLGPAVGRGLHAGLRRRRELDVCCPRTRRHAWRLTIGSHSSAERPAIGQKQNTTAREREDERARRHPAPLESVRIRITAPVRLAAIAITCGARSEPISPRRSSGPKR